MENEENALVEKKDEEVNEENTSNDDAQKEKKQKKVKGPINMAKGGLLWSVWNFLEAALVIVLGILCFVYTAKASQEGSEITYDKVISIIILVGGIFLIAGGALKIIVNFLPVVGRNIIDAAVKAKVKAELSYDMVVGGAIELAIGVAFVISYQSTSGEMNQFVDFIATFLAVFIGVLVIAAGVSLVLFAIGFIVSKLYKLYLPILEIIFGAALIALGIVVLYFLAGNADLTKIISLIVLGIILVLAGIAMAIMTVIEINKAHFKKAVAQEVKDSMEVVDGPSEEQK